MKFPLHLRPLKSSTRRARFGADAAGTKLFVDSFDKKKKKKKKCEEEIASFRRLTEFLMQSRNYSHLLASNDLEFPTNVSQNIKIFQLCTEGRVVEEKKKKEKPRSLFRSFCLITRIRKKKLALGNFLEWRKNVWTGKF